MACAARSARKPASMLSPSPSPGSTRTCLEASSHSCSGARSPGGPARQRRNDCLPLGHRDRHRRAGQPGLRRPHPRRSARRATASHPPARRRTRALAQDNPARRGSTPGFAPVTALRCRIIPYFDQDGACGAAPGVSAGLCRWAARPAHAGPLPRPVRPGSPAPPDEVRARHTAGAPSSLPGIPERRWRLCLRSRTPGCLWSRSRRGCMCPDRGMSSRSRRLRG